jgi:LDH2 family malate/lactate/ureidoglycolate dehydrogenase
MTIGVRISAPALAAFSTDLLQRAGAEKPPAEAATRAMMHASIHGVDSHGIRLLPWYAECLRDGTAQGHGDIAVTRPRAGTAVIDARHALGHIACYRGMEEACAIARQQGIGLALVINSTHFGAAGAYPMAAAEQGFIGFITSNSGALVIPHGGTQPLHGTNPIALAAPNPGGDPFLLDIATSSFPWNKVLRYRTEELTLPEGVATAEDGTFTADPAIARMLAPLGGRDFGYKGAGLGGLADILGGVLTGMRLSCEQDGRNHSDSFLGHFIMAVDPTLLMPLEAFGMRLRDYFAAFALQPGAMPAGGPEWRCRDERLKLGIPLPPGLVADLRQAGDLAGLPLPV